MGWAGTRRALQSRPVFVIEEASSATPEVVEAVTRLLPLLSSTAAAPSAGDVEEMVSSPATTLFIARDGQGGPIVGTLTLALFRIPSGIRAWIEDVIVAEEARGSREDGRRCGEQLTLAAVEAARRAGARTVELTSRPSRVAANRLYQRLGFELRETNVYRYELR